MRSRYAEVRRSERAWGHRTYEGDWLRLEIAWRRLMRTIWRALLERSPR